MKTIHLTDEQENFLIGALTDVIRQLK